MDPVPSSNPAPQAAFVPLAVPGLPQEVQQIEYGRSLAVVIPDQAVAETGIRTTPNLAREIREGVRSFMDRSQWPPITRVGGEEIWDAKQMRRDYQEVAVLAADLVQRSRTEGDCCFVFRANIPMNPAVGWFENGAWVLHPQDRLPPGVPVIGMADDGLYACFEPARLPAVQRALLTSYFGSGAFDAAAFMATTYDPRHIVNLQYKFPSKEAQKTFEGMCSTADDPVNRVLSGLSGLFRDSQAYVRRAGELVAEHGWSRYNRTVLAVGPEPGGPLEFYTLQEMAPPEIMEFVRAHSGIHQPSVFGLVEGGSFALGLIRGGEITDLGSKEGYYRGAQGMWLGYLRLS